MMLGTGPGSHVEVNHAKRISMNFNEFLASATWWALSKAFRSQMRASSRSVKSALMERPSSAASTRASRRRSASSFKVTLVFMGGYQHVIHVQHYHACWQGPRSKHRSLQPPVAASLENQLRPRG